MTTKKLSKNNNISTKKNKPKTTRRTQQTKPLKPLHQIRTDVAGIDLGADSHFVAASEEPGQVTIRKFGVFTQDLMDMVEWLKKCKVKSIAMEATGVYWMHIYDILEQQGFEVVLVDTHKIKNVSGKKTDVQDAEWLYQLHSYGLLSGAFVPDQNISELRTYDRMREQKIQQAATCIQRMQKALIRMNVRLDNVISDITGETGMRIIKAILEGERDPKKLALLRDPRCKNSVEIIEESLKGNYKYDQLFALRMELNEYEYLKLQIHKCECKIYEKLNEFEDRALDGESEQKLTTFKKNQKQKTGDFSFDLTSLLFQKTGVDLTELPGIGASTALLIISEIGLDMSRWKSDKHFASWLGLCPNNKKSGGKVLRSRTRKCKNRAAIGLRMSVSSLYRESNDTAVGAFYRRKRGQLGPTAAITAGANKLAKLLYNSLATRKTFIEPGVSKYMAQQKEKYLRRTRKTLKKLGYEIKEKAA